MEKENFVLELPLKVEKWQSDILNKRYEYLRQIYNFTQRKLKNQYIYFSQMAEFKNCKTKKDKSDFFKNHKFRISGVDKDVTFSEFGIITYVNQLAKKKVSKDKCYKDFGINTGILSQLSKNIWSAWDKKIYGKANFVHTKKFGELNSLPFKKSNGYFCGLTIDMNTLTLDFNINGKQGKNAEKICLKVDAKKLTDYEMCALKDGYDSLRDGLKIVRKLIRGNYKYYVQFTIDGEKPQKGRTLGKGTVGLDVGPSTIAVSSLNGVSIDTIAEKCDDIENDISRISRKMERSKRANNPGNFTEDGQIKRIDKKNGERRTWVKSKRYVKLQNKKSNLQRKQAAIRKIEQNILANKLLQLGDTFIVEENKYSAWAKRAKETKINKKGKYQSKKRFGKSIANHAPSQQITILKNKVKSLGGTFVEVDIKNAASKFDFTNNTFAQERSLSERLITLSNGNTHQRDMMAAFNLQHIDTNEGTLKVYHVEDMKKDYPIFCRLEQEEVERFKNGYKTRHMATIGL